MADSPGHDVRGLFRCPTSKFVSMFETFFAELRSAKIPVTLKEYLTLLEAVGCRRRRKSRRGFLLSRPREPREGRAQSRSFRSGLRARLQGARADHRYARGRDPGRMAAPRRDALSERGRQEEDRRAWRLGDDHGGAEEAPRRAERTPPGRQQVDRHRRHVTLSAPTATIRPASASVSTKAGIGAPSRFGTSASSRISPALRKSARGRSRSRCAG